MYQYEFGGKELEAQGSSAICSDGTIRLCVMLNMLGVAVEVESMPDCYLITMVNACWDFVDIEGFDSEPYRISSPAGIANYLRTALPMVEFNDSAIDNIDKAAGHIWREPIEMRKHVTKVVAEHTEHTEL